MNASYASLMPGAGVHAVFPDGIHVGRQDILLFSTADWDNPFWTNKQHMACQFAKRGYRVLYVESLGLRRPTLHRRDLRRMGRRLLRLLAGAREVRPGIWRVSPLAIPFQASARARACNMVLLRAQLRLCLSRLGMKRPLIWTYNPVIAPLCAALPKRGIVYHCVDDLSAAPGIDGPTIRAGEEALGRVADLCFATSPCLRDRMTPLFPRVEYEPNVCEQAFFATAELTAEPAELAAIPRPRLLFVGALSEYKVDFDLMERLARRNPDRHWVLVGPVGEGQPGSRRPPELPNVHVLGPRVYGRLPYFMGHCDMAVLPIPHNDYTDAMFPMKFFEFLAAGLPVVGTRLPALENFTDLYFPCDGDDEFAHAMDGVLGGQRHDAAAIDAACRRHSWDARFARMERILDEVFPGVLRKESGVCACA